jgi:hypothetical protein
LQKEAYYIRWIGKNLKNVWRTPWFGTVPVPDVRTPEIGGRGGIRREKGGGRKKEEGEGRRRLYQIRSDVRW